MRSTTKRPSVRERGSVTFRLKIVLFLRSELFPIIFVLALKPLLLCRKLSDSVVGERRDECATANQFNPVDVKGELGEDARLTLDAASEDVRCETNDGTVVEDQRTSKIAIARSSSAWQSSGQNREQGW